MPVSFLPLLLAIVVGGGLAVVIIGISHVIGPSKKDNIKFIPYECGHDPLGYARGKINIKFFVIAIIFIIFDIDGLSIVPWALIVRELGWFGIIEIGIFVLFMVFALVYAIRKGAFKWE
ncbi:MAG: NADH-quinone oxidoreductase subunit A [Acidobacteria bacterium]|nr:NADH-quinone oxidoreductase subunit A [Acidobacteriota bacterium]